MPWSARPYGDAGIRAFAYPGLRIVAGFRGVLAGDGIREAKVFGFLQ